jgi:hypothetical protein
MWGVIWSQAAASLLPGDYFHWISLLSHSSLYTVSSVTLFSCHNSTAVEWSLGQSKNFGGCNWKIIVAWLTISPHYWEIKGLKHLGGWSLHGFWYIGRETELHPRSNSQGSAYKPSTCRQGDDMQALSFHHKEVLHKKRVTCV